jgi:anti-sigma B factor antagonist
MSTRFELEAPVIHVVEATEAITALDLEGEFDMSMALSISEQAQRALANDKHLIINLSDATFIDSSVVHALFKAEEAARSADRVFVLQFGTHAAVERVLAITAVDKNLPVASTRAKAIELIDQQLSPTRAP